MEWYYALDDDQLGPIPQAEFDQLVRSGTIHPDTLVWHSDMTDWIPYAQYLESQGGDETALEDESVFAKGTCAECGMSFPRGELIAYSGMLVCADCKPIFFQRVKEGAALPASMRYAGFWIRFGATAVDMVLLLVVSLPLQLMTGGASLFNNDGGIGLIFIVVITLIGYLIPIVYETWFLGKYGATPGKMAFGLRVVRADGAAIAYSRALSRYFAEILSAMIFMIGYIMAAFDDEKRALHDRICDTRVIFAN